jgi:NAD(P)-dependent dehydrogenase (short-subunit alcohol dehydrogenase family)
MHVVITGGSGLIGFAQAAGLASAGCKVILLSRRPETVRGLPSHARAERWEYAER